VWSLRVAIEVAAMLVLHSTDARDAESCGPGATPTTMGSKPSRAV
jgi:hypothetical protein